MRKVLLIILCFFFPFIAVLIQQRVATARRQLHPVTVIAMELDGLRGGTTTTIDEAMRALGSVGPLKDRPGFEPMVQAFAGMMMMSLVLQDAVRRLDGAAAIAQAPPVLRPLVGREHRERDEAGVGLDEGAVVDAVIVVIAVAGVAVAAAQLAAVDQRHGRGAQGRGWAKRKCAALGAAARRYGRAADARRNRT